MLKDLAITLALIFAMVGSVLLPYSLLLVMAKTSVTSLGLLVLATTIGLVIYSWSFIGKIFSSNHREVKMAVVFLIVLSVVAWSFSAYVMSTIFQIRTL